MKTAAILLSRQPLRPNGRTEWVMQLQKAVKWCKSNNFLLLTSHGLQTWGMITAAGVVHHVPMRVYVLPDTSLPIDREAWLRTQYGLERAEAHFLHVDSDSSDRTAQRRDVHIVHDAEILIPISIRPKGAIARLLDEARSAGKRVVEDFQCAYKDRTDRLAYEVHPADLNPELAILSDQYLFHWTRATNSVWPGERLIDYYRDIMESEIYPRTAFDTLCRILHDRLLCASPRHMPGRIPTISFTGLSPIETAPLMRWRARYSEMSFEPYGVGIKKLAGEQSGIRPVIYHDENETPTSANDNQWLTQSTGKITDWRQEKEYRYRGDLSLSGFSSDEMTVVCRTANEAHEIERQYKLKAIPYCRD